MIRYLVLWALFLNITVILWLLIISHFLEEKKRLSYYYIAMPGKANMSMLIIHKPWVVYIEFIYMYLYSISKILTLKLLKNKQCLSK